MPKLKWSVNADDSELVGSYYEGPVPPVDSYRCRLKWFKLGLDKNDDPHINGPAEIAELNGDKKQYNGYTIWVSQSFSGNEMSRAFMARLAKAIGVEDWRGELELDVSTSRFTKAAPADVRRIAGVKIGDNLLQIATRAGTDQNGNARLEPLNFRAVEDDEAEDEEEYEEYEDDDEDEEETPPPPKSRKAPAKKSTRRRPEPEPEDEDEDEDEYDDEEDEEEPPPPRKRAKKAVAKKATRRPRRRAADEDEDEDGEPPF